MPGKKIARKRPGLRCEADLALQTERALSPPFLFTVGCVLFSTFPSRGPSEVVAEKGVRLSPRAPSGLAETRTQGPWRPHVGSHQRRETSVSHEAEEERMRMKARMENNSDKNECVYDNIKIKLESTKLEIWFVCSVQVRGCCGAYM